MKQTFLWLILLVLLVPTGVRAEVSVEASVDRTRIAAGESLELQVSISGGKGEPDIGSISDFKVVSRGSSTNISMINGSFSQTVSYSYTLIPLKEGKLIIPAIPVSVDGKTYTSKPFWIEVSAAAPAPKDSTQKIFVEALISEKNPYAGQQIIYSFKLFQAAEIAEASFQQPPFTGFTANKIEEQKRYRKVMQGREYLITEINFILIPIKPGKITIDPARLTANVVVGSGSRRDMFDPFGNFNQRMESRAFQTETIAVDVRPLPPYPGNDTFSGLVGKFEIRSSIEPRQLKAGESSTLSLVIEGTGNIGDSQKPAIESPKSFKVYEDQPKTDIKLTPQGYTGKKDFRTALVPMEPGTFDLAPVRLTYFDTETGKYVTKVAQSLHLKVFPSDEKQVPPEKVTAPSLPETFVQKKQVEFTGRDILPLKEDASALTPQKGMTPPVFLLWLFGPALICGLFTCGLIFSRKTHDPAKIMAERALKALKLAGECTDAGEFLSHLYRAVISSILSVAGTFGESLTSAEAAEILRKKGRAETLAQQAARLLEKIESAKFSGQMTEQELQQVLLAETRALVKDIQG